jgi:transposase
MVSYLASVRQIITSGQRRRRWTAAEKVWIVEEPFEPGLTVSLVARGAALHRTSSSGGAYWRRKDSRTAAAVARR